jgi:cytosine/adenosine deaminase-related metal-dependent hydrolase
LRQMPQERSWILRGARIARGAEETAASDIEIRAGRIVALESSRPSRARALELDLRGCLVLPGLINAHDHLEFSLFPRLGRGPYPNAGAWARDIYQPHRSPVKEHLLVPLPVRLRWGGIKNLLSGVTTICHHNPYNARVFEHNFPARVQKRFGWAHSLEFAPDLGSRFRETSPEWPFIVHLGEASDHQGKLEIFRLHELGALDRRTVLVHGVALGRKGLRVAKEKGAALVWCPSSNLFILGRTLSQAALNNGVPLALGTDSALSGKGDLLDEFRLAQRVSGLSSSRLYRMVTEDAARILRLENGEGTITEGGVADLLVVRNTGRSPAETLTRLRTGAMELVILGGRIKQVSPRLTPRLPITVRKRLRSLTLEEKRRVFLDADLPGIYAWTSRVLGPEIRLAGKKIRIDD